MSHNYRSLKAIAQEIALDWSNQGKGGVNYAAKPYLEAMFSLDKIGDKFFEDSGVSVVAYFLANANSWRGDVARRIKVELNRMLLGKPVPQPPIESNAYIAGVQGEQS